MQSLQKFFIFFIVGITYEIITTGKTRLLMLNGHTFSKNSRRGLYYCSKMVSSKCKASVKLDGSGSIERIREDHNHAPPKYIKTPSGLSVKISP